MVNWGQTRVADLIERSDDVVIEPPQVYAIDLNDTYLAGDVEITQITGYKIGTIRGYVSDGNSSATKLDAGITFTGDAVDITNVAIFYVTVYSDQASAVDGLSIQQSADGINWDHVDVFTVPAATGKTFSFNPSAKWMRVVYTNGIVDQLEFRLQTILKSVYSKPSSHRIQDSISSDDDAELTKSVITGEDENGIFQNVRVNSDGLLEITDFFLEVAKGNIPGHSKVSKFGENNTVGSAPETIWDAGGLYPWATWDVSGPTTVNLQSTDINDTAAGTGARTIQIEGLDENWEEQEEIIVLAGTTPVASIGQWQRLHRMVVVTGGTFNGAIGNITATIGAVTVAQVVNGNNQTLMAVYTIPAGKTAYVVFGKTSCGKAADAKVKFFVRPPGGVFNVQHTANLYQNSYDYPFSAVPSVDTMTDLEVRATSTNPSGFEVTMAFDVILVDN